ncbi:ABC transporter permease [Caldisericum exile]|uniref:Molybdate ABC transporter permease protein n=1 Tax=Caldisericum exile (strain DSM 21853 / NBRC 104410 / AZM16c01) TaxID=511051 RepID=A0A7U6GDX9_CALEA|nr:ABC transporter permease [Caldisericum exile]BAL80575.1 putative molybdate ABC transporter permease protein [Caldisericum exile AZM16c01]
MKIFETLQKFLLLILLIIIISGLIVLFIEISPYQLLKTLQSREFIFSIKFSLMTSIVSLFLSFFFSLPVAYFLARKNFFGKPFVQNLLDIPVSLSPLVIGLMYLILFGGPFGKLLDKFNISFVFTPLGVIFAQFIVITPFVEKNIEVAFSKISERYEFIGQTMGLNDFEIFVKIIFPMAQEGIVAGLILGWSRAISEFGATVMLAGAIRMKTETLPIAVFLGVNSYDMNLAISAGIIMVLISFLIHILVRRVFKNYAIY